MKMLIMVYNEAADEAVIDTLKKANIKGYTKWKEAYGEGTETEPKLGTHYWPGKNNVLATVVSDEKMPAVAGAIRRLKSKRSKFGLKVFVLETTELI